MHLYSEMEILNSCSVCPPTARSTRWKHKLEIHYDRTSWWNPWNHQFIATKSRMLLMSR